MASLDFYMSKGSNSVGATIHIVESPDKSEDLQAEGEALGGLLWQMMPHKAFVAMIKELNYLNEERIEDGN